MKLKHLKLSAAAVLVSAQAHAAIFTLDFPSTNYFLPNGQLATMGTTNSDGSAVMSTLNPSSGYPTASGNSSYGSTARVGALNTAANGSVYYGMSFTPFAGYKIRFSDFDFGIRSTSTGPTSYALRTSADNYASNVVSGTIGADGAWGYKNNNFNTFENGTLTVRLYLYGGSGSVATGSMNVQLDDVRFDIAAVGTFSNPNLLSRQVLTLSGGSGAYTPASSTYMAGSTGFTVNGLSAGDASNLVSLAVAYSGTPLTADSFGNAESFTSYANYAALLAAQPWVAGTNLAGLNATGFALLTRTASSSAATVDLTSGGVSGTTLLGAAAVPEPASLSLLALGGVAALRRRR